MQLVYRQFFLDDDIARFDFAACQAWLSGTYWSPGITRAEVEHGFRNSALVVGAYGDGVQVGCMRVASDRTRFAYVMDVFVDPGSRGQGLGKALMRLRSTITSFGSSTSGCSAPRMRTTCIAPSASTLSSIQNGSCPSNVRVPG